MTATEPQVSFTESRPAPPGYTLRRVAASVLAVLSVMLLVWYLLMNAAVHALVTDEAIELVAVELVELPLVADGYAVLATAQVIENRPFGYETSPDDWPSVNGRRTFTRPDGSRVVVPDAQIGEVRAAIADTYVDVFADATVTSWLLGMGRDVDPNIDLTPVLIPAWETLVVHHPQLEQPSGDVLTEVAQPSGYLVPVDALRGTRNTAALFAGLLMFAGIVVAPTPVRSRLRGFAGKVAAAATIGLVASMALASASRLANVNDEPGNSAQGLFLLFTEPLRISSLAMLAVAAVLGLSVFLPAQFFQLGRKT